jgi:hypothetical protein
LNSHTRPALFKKKIKVQSNNHVEKTSGAGIWKDFCSNSNMKYKILSAAIIICFYITSCKSEKAKKYSDLIVSKEKTVEAGIAQATKKLQAYFITDETDSIVAVSTRMENAINAIIQDIKNTKPPKLKEAENFKEETLKYLEYRKNNFTVYKNYGLQTTPEGRELERMNMTVMQRQEKTMNYNLQAAQMNFAKANHVKIKQ